MSAKNKNMNPDKLTQWGDDLVCPVCYGRLRFEVATVVCAGCGRTYPIVDGIPVLIPQRASGPSTN